MNQNKGTVEEFQEFLRSTRTSRLMEMANYQKRDTNLPVNIWIDSGMAYKNSGHYKRIKFQLNTSSNVQKAHFASISLEDCKAIEKTIGRSELSQKDIHGVETFAYNNQFALNAVSDGILSESEFFPVIIKGVDMAADEDRQKAIDKVKEIIQKNKDEGYYSTEQQTMAERYLTQHIYGSGVETELERLSEMANLRKKNTGLPVNIWVDEAETYKSGRHAKRIKFQTNTDLKFREDSTCPMLLDGSIPDSVSRSIQFDKDFSIGTKEISAVRNFVLNNSYALDKLADQEIWREDFESIFIPGGVPAKPEEIDTLKKAVDKLAREKYI